jgi:nucleoside 2-deoxyribosyltransferase
VAELLPGVYLAGPTVFVPLDAQAGLENVPPGRALVTRIVQADIALMHRADAGLFCLDGFRRGPEMDPGTAFEIGYMHAIGKKLSGWTRDTRDYPARVAAFFTDTFGLDLQAGTGGGTGARSGQLRDPDGILVHSEGCLQNAMTHVAIELSGGAVHADPNWHTAFDAAVRDLAERLKKRAGKTVLF